MKARKFNKPAVLLGTAVAAVLVAIPGASFYYESTAGKSCARCHEIRPAYDLWHSSTHREVNCTACHGGTLTLDVSFHLTNARRVATHFLGRTPERVRIRDVDVNQLTERCASCHAQEFADWKAGPHSVTYGKLFLDEEHNRKRLLIDDCLRCHGMFFEGAIQDLVTPISTEGPWRFVAPSLADEPAIPCLACHGVHGEGDPLPREREQAVPGPKQEIFRPSLALFDRRALLHLPAAGLPLPEMREADRAVEMSPDQRQALCYQCHAPLAGFHVGSGDDRTPVGVHEGLSCLACHEKHRKTTRASCANCHPRLSNCGLDVETMDTTFRSPDSKHNIHWVKCVDCHPKGIPPKRAARPAR